ncbi:hypothetical protein [Asticcacaulis sp.]|uniref:hypothetical protein n=1 Tax=Asticcacaulis sp. TaxID=1872648 RepID=UPI00263201B1|nr:hypothetical protein [Asticcacaulis sp.]
MNIPALLLLLLATSPLACHGEEAKSVNKGLLEKFSSDLNDFSSVEKFEKYGNLKLKLKHSDDFRDIYECFGSDFDCTYSVKKGDDGKISFGFSILFNEKGEMLSFKDANLFIVSKGWKRTYISKPVYGKYPCDYSIRYKKGNRELIVGRYDCFPETLDVQSSLNDKSSIDKIDMSQISVSYITLNGQ